MVSVWKSRGFFSSEKSSRVRDFNPSAPIILVLTPTPTHTSKNSSFHTNNTLPRNNSEGFKTTAHTLKCPITKLGMALTFCPVHSLRPTTSPFSTHLSSPTVTSAYQPQLRFGMPRDPKQKWTILFRFRFLQ